MILILSRILSTDLSYHLKQKAADPVDNEESVACNSKNPHTFAKMNAVETNHEKNKEFIETNSLNQLNECLHLRRASITEVAPQVGCTSPHSRNQRPPKGGKVRFFAKFRVA